MVALGAVAVARGQVIDTYGDWDGNITNGWQQIAQSFVAPSNNLLNYKFNLQGGGANVEFDVFAWVPGSGPVGGALYTHTFAYTGAGNYTMSNINLALTPGATYAAIVNMLGYTDKSQEYQTNQNSYNQGSGSWYSTSYGGWNFYPTYNTRFRAEFGAVPEPATFAILAIGVAPFIRRRKRA